jgi:SAM-dependent methyltransferase
MLAAGAADYVIAAAEKLPFRTGAFDCCFSLLVLQELRDRALALKEMHRVTRPGGIVAACQWDFQDGMPMISALRQALAAVGLDLRERTERRSAPGFTSLSELESTWRSVGLENIETARLTVALSYDNFADLWSPILAGSTPTTAIVAALPTDTREVVSSKLKEIIPQARNNHPFSLAAHAFAIRGQTSS